MKVKYQPPENHYIQLDIQFATEYGVNEALLTDKTYRLQNKLQGYIDDQDNKWIRMTAQEWGKELPFWSKNTIWRTIESAIDQGILLTRTFTGRSKWYRLNPDFVATPQNGESQLPKMGNRTPQNGELPRVLIQESFPNKDNNNDLTAFWKTYESEIGSISPIIAQRFQDYARDCPEKWMIDAVNLAVENNVRKPNYIYSILNGCISTKTPPGQKDKGRKTDGRNQNGRSSGSTEPGDNAKAISRLAKLTSRAGSSRA